MVVGREIISRVAEFYVGNSGDNLSANVATRPETSSSACETCSHVPSRIREPFPTTVNNSPDHIREPHTVCHRLLHPRTPKSSTRHRLFSAFGTSNTCFCFGLTVTSSQTASQHSHTRVARSGAAWSSALAALSALAAAAPPAILIRYVSTG
eukprot:1156489-Rhodomonas_salina.1